MFACVQLTQLLHKFCACYFVILYIFFTLPLPSHIACMTLTTCVIIYGQSHCSETAGVQSICTEQLYSDQSAELWANKQYSSFYFRLQILQKLKIVKECVLKSFQIHSCTFQDESSEVEGSSILSTKFQDVWKFPALSRLYHSSCFGARITVSTKEFLWNPSFYSNLIFSGILGL